MQRFLAARALPAIEIGDDQSYARTVRMPNGGWAVIQMRPIAGEDALEFRARGADTSALPHLSSVARRIFDLGADPATIVSALQPDAILGPLVKRRPGLWIPGVWDPFECAVRAIVGQQVSLLAGITLVTRLVQRAGQAIATPIEGLTHLFPRPSDVVAADLGGLGLTGGRITALKEVAAAIVDGTLDFSTSTDEVVGQLTRIRGIGPWTAQYVALRALGAPDAFLCSDLVLRRIAAGNSEETLTPSALEKRAEAWRPWRAYAAIHLWAAAVDQTEARGQAMLISKPRAARPR